MVSIFGKLGSQSQEGQQEGRQQGLVSSNLDRAIGAGVTFSGVGPVAGSLDDVGIGCAIYLITGQPSSVRSEAVHLPTKEAPHLACTLEATSPAPKIVGKSVFATL